jgi:hypothetical protein
LDIQRSNDTVEGLSITGFSAGNGVYIHTGSTGDTVVGDFVGVAPDGTAHGNSTGIYIPDSTGAVIGGAGLAGYPPDPLGAVNVISGNSGSGRRFLRPVTRSQGTSSVQLPAAPVS